MKFHTPSSPDFVAPRPLFAIAAVAQNGVVGVGNRLPWHLPGDFQFFKRTTLGHILVMGRKTYESIGRPLPGRTTVVLSRSGAGGVAASGAAGVRVVGGWEELWGIEPEKNLFLAGGARLYAEALPWCEGLFLTHVHATPAGDAFFPPYEQWFDAGEIIESCPQFTIRYHKRRR
ncbi:MAG: dihydrofolate reductase [Puniceicoccales bacterium]|jgi:dihydrofolate reductase|nr:dihydrofolate reductase [Puniceicoccales bacterium]